MSNTTGLRRTSSLVFDASARTEKPHARLGINDSVKIKSNGKKGTIVIPDSEEETDRAYVLPAHSNVSPVKQLPLKVMELISDSSEEEEETPLSRDEARLRKDKGRAAEDLFIDSPYTSNIPCSISKAKSAIESSEDEDSAGAECYKLNRTKIPGRSAWTRRMIISDSEDSADEELDQRDVEEGNEGDDDAILVLNDLPAARRPAAKPSALPVETLARLMNSGPASDIQETPGGSRVLISGRTPPQTPVQNRLLEGSGRTPDYFDLEPSSPIKGKGRKKASKNTPLVKSATPVIAHGGPSKTVTPSNAPAKKGRRISKKALAAARQEHLQNYAQQLFTELNETVFDNGLPATTTLSWNKRMQTTAGRAKWHSSAIEGIETTSIELAAKVLDSEERIRNTLSHEMCHLASWVIDRNPKENHGQIFMKWAGKVMRKRPDIEISTRHSYEITYKYEWKCQNNECGYVTQLWSSQQVYRSHEVEYAIVSLKSAGGDLLPLFQTRARKTKAGGRLEAEKKRDSPTILDKFLARTIPVDNPSHLREAGITVVVSDAETESEGDDVEILPPRKGMETPNGNPTKPPAATTDRTDKEGESTDRVVSGLIKHLSIIDLTKD